MWSVVPGATEVDPLYRHGYVSLAYKLIRYHLIILIQLIISMGEVNKDRGMDGLG